MLNKIKLLIAFEGEKELNFYDWERSQVMIMGSWPRIILVEYFEKDSSFLQTSAV